MSTSKQFNRPIEFLSTQPIVGNSGGAVYIVGGLNVSNLNVSNNVTIANLTITNNLFTSTGSTLLSSQWVNVSTGISYTSANVGIGTTSPGFNLDVSGGARITGGLTTGTLTTIIGASIPNLLSSVISTSSLIISSGLLSTFNSNTIGSIFTTNGNVGINTTSPTTTLDINGNIRINTSNSTTSNRITTNATDNFIYSSNTIGHYSLMWALDQASIYSMCYLSGYGGQRFFTLGQPRMAIDLNGNVGIANTAPSFKLDVTGTARITSSLTTANIYSTNQTTTNIVGTNTSIANLTTLTGTFLSQTVGTIVVTTSASLIGNTNTIGNLFTTGGNVGINTVSPGFTLDVTGTARISGSGQQTVTFKNNPTGTTLDISPGYRGGTLTGGWTTLDPNNGTSGSYGIYIFDGLELAGGSATTLANVLITSTLNATFNSNTIGSIFTTNGNVGIGTVSPNNILDIQRNGSAVINLQNTGTGASQLQLFSHSDTNNYFQTTGDVSFTAIGQSVTRNLRLTTGGNVLIGATNTFSPVSLLTINAGNVTTITQASIAFSFAPAPGYYHFIGSRHNNASGTNQNSIDFYLNNSSTQTGSSSPNFGNVNSMSVTATGVGIFNSNPSTTLDVNGTVRITSTLSLTNGFSSTTALNSNVLFTRVSNDYNHFIGYGGINNSISNYAGDGTIVSGNIGGALAYQGGTGINGQVAKLVWNTIGVGINTTNPQFALDVSGTGRFSGALTIPTTAIIGTILGNSNTQLANDTLYLGAGGNSNFFIDRTNSGGSLIYGFNTPKSILNPIIQIYNNSTDRTVLLNIISKGTTGTDQVQVNTYLNANFNSNTLGNIFTTGGNVGINTINPTTTLDVNGNIRMNTSSSTTSNRITTSPTDNFFYSSNTVGHYSLMWAIDQTTAAGPMSYLSGYGGQRFFTTGQPRMVIDVNGSVGINTTSPAFTLDVNGSGHYSGSLLVGLTSSNNVGVSNGVATSALTIGSAGGSIYFRDISPGIIQTQTYASGANTGQIQLQPFGGNVGINTSSAVYTLDVNGSVNVNKSNNVFNKLLILYDINSADSLSTATSFYGFGVNNGTLRYQVNGSGDVHRFYCAGTNYFVISSAGGANVSDKRFKSEIINIENALDKIKQLQGITFKMENIEKRQMGFLAQDVKKVIPEVVQVNNTENEKDLHYLSYDKLVPLLTEGIKEQQQQINDQQQQINDQQQQINDQQQQINDQQQQINSLVELIKIRNT